MGGDQIIQPLFGEVGVRPALMVIAGCPAATFLAFEIIHDIRAYQTAVAAGKPAIINCAFGLFLVFIGTPIYFLCKRRSAGEPTA